MLNPDFVCTIELTELYMKKERVAKVCKVCRKYLIHEQKSVFEGMITQAKLQQLRTELEIYCAIGG